MTDRSLHEVKYNLSIIIFLVSLLRRAQRLVSFLCCDEHRGWCPFYVAKDGLFLHRYESNSWFSCCCKHGSLGLVVLSSFLREVVGFLRCYEQDGWFHRCLITYSYKKKRSFFQFGQADDNTGCQDVFCCKYCFYFFINLLLWSRLSKQKKNAISYC